MGSSTRSALAALRSEVSRAGVTDLNVGESLFQIARTLDENPALRHALTEPEADAGAKRALVNRIFGSLDARAVEIAASAANQRWSRSEDLVSGLDETGIRAIAETARGVAPALDGEIIGFSQLIETNGELELALRNKLAPAKAKRELVVKVAQGSLSRAALSIIERMVERGIARNVRLSLTRAATIIAEQLGYRIASVTVAAPLSAEQLQELGRSLAERYNTPVRIDELIDKRVLGGMRVELGGETIDGTVATRLAELRARLAG